MPAISQIGFGTNDYATLPAWWAAEQNNDYSGAGPIAEIDSSAPQTLTANLQIRFGSSTRATIRAAVGSEFDGNFGGTHAKILGGFDLDVRKANFTLSGIDFTGNFVSSGDTYNNALIEDCGVRGSFYLDKTLTTPITIRNSVLYSATVTNNRVLYLIGSDTTLDNVTVVGLNAATPLGAIYVRNNGTDLIVNDVAVYAVGATYAIHSGDTPTVSGDYNAGSDALLPGANSIATLGTDDFENYSALDFRIKFTSELATSGTAGGGVGAFVQAPALQVVTYPASMTREATAVFGVTSPNITLTTGNTTVDSTIGAKALTVSTVTATGGDGYDVEVTVPASLALQHSALGYTWLMSSGVESYTSALVPLTPASGQTYTNLVSPSTASGSILEGYTGDTPVTGDQVVYDSPSSPSSIPFTVGSTGEWIFDFEPTVNQTVSRYVIQADGTVGATETATYTVSGGEPSQASNIILRDVLKPVLSNVLRNISEE